MTACIKNFHHSLFGAVDRPDDGEGGVEKSKKSKGDEGRRINVELTYGFFPPCRGLGFASSSSLIGVMADW